MNSNSILELAPARPLLQRSAVSRHSMHAARQSALEALRATALQAQNLAPDADLMRALRASAGGGDWAGM